MATDPRLETYLSKLERVLRPFPVSDRAEIVIEIKSHVLAALDRDPQVPLDTILSALGEPETVANRYLMERGLQTATPSISPIVKWIVIGFLGTLAMILFFAGALAWKFFPLLTGENSQHRSAMIDAWLSFDGKDGKSWRKEISGTQVLNAEQKKKLALKFSNGQVDLKTSNGPEVQWNCRLYGKEAELHPSVTTTEFTLDFSAMGGIRCDIEIPEASVVSLSGTNGKVDVTRPRFDLDLQMTNGKVGIEPDPDQKYHYALSVANGSAGTFAESVPAGTPDAHTIGVKLVNGRISQDD